MTKYRIRLSTGRVLGPFEVSQLQELKLNGHIKGNEEAQVYPTGEWKSIQSFDFYNELLDENKTIYSSKSDNNQEHTFVLDLTKIKNKQQEKEIEKLGNETQPSVEELTETVRMEVINKNTEANHIPEPLPIELKQLELEKSSIAVIEDEQIIDDGHEKTLINPVAQQELQKMQKLLKEEEERKKEEQEKLRKLKEEELKQQEMVPAIPEFVEEKASPEEATQLLKIDPGQLIEKAQVAEQDAEKEIKKKNKKRNNYLKEEALEEVPKKKNKLWLIVGSAILIGLILFGDQGSKKPTFKSLKPLIVFPVPFDKADSAKSKASFARGMTALNEGTYVQLINAGVNFRESYENDLDNLDALNFMLRVYAEQLKHSQKLLQDAQIVFNIIQSKRPFLSQDVNGVIGLNLFYMAINKPEAAIDAVQKYLKLNPKNITQDLFAVYLSSLIKQGKLDVANQFYQALLKAPDKNRYAYSALIDYLILNQEIEKADEYLDEAIKKYPQISFFYLKKAELLLKSKETDQATVFLKKVDALNCDYNNLDRAKFLELRGLVSALSKKPKEAAKYFADSLKLFESDELRLKLAELKTTDGTNENVDKLIQESKAVKYLLQAKDYYDKRNFNFALSSAAKASDAFPGHIPSELFLAKVQLRLGLAQEGLKTLEALSLKYPEDKSINLALIEGYIETFKFHNARNGIQKMASTVHRESWEFASINAKLHLKSGDSLQAMAWLRSSTKMNPLNDSDFYSLANIFLKKGNFESARMLLNICMELDPINPDYRISYARLLYESKDDLAAIGYLLSLNEEFKDNPKIMSEIAIFYYRSGKVKDYLDYKKKLEKNYATDKALYEFLIKAALLDDRHTEVPGLVEKLIEIEPGNLEYMMTAGKVLFENGKLVEAAKWFARVKNKLPTYPKVLYYVAKIDFLSGDVESAKKKIEEDIKENGESDDSFVFLAEIAVSKDELINAENYYKRAQKMNPKSYEAIVGLADLSTKRNNLDQALDLYKRAMKLRQEEPIVHKKIGDVYRQLGQGALAIEAYRLYLDMEPESPHKSNLEAYINLMQ